MEGWLKKFVETIRLFQITIYPKRYFEIDFQTAEIYIKHDPSAIHNPVGWQKEHKSNVKSIPFRSVLDCYTPGDELNKVSLPKKWTFPFYLITIERKFVLCAPSD